MSKKNARMTVEDARKAILEGGCPEFAEVDGDLWLRAAPSLDRLPVGLKVRGSLWITGCDRLERLPHGLEAESLFVKDCAVLEGFAERRRFRVPGGLTFEDCPGLRTFPKRLEVGGDLGIEGCPQAWSATGRAPKSLDVSGRAHIGRCAGLARLPADTAVWSALSVFGCDRLLRLPERLSVGSLHIVDCAALRGFHPGYQARGFQVRGALSFDGCPALSDFPAWLSAGWTFTMQRCERAFGPPDPARGSHPPKGLYVGRCATIRLCPSMSRLPQRVEVGTTLRIAECDGLTGVGGGGKAEAPEVGHGCTLLGCAGLQRVDGIAFRSPAWLEVKRCPELQAIGDGVGPLDRLDVEGCPALVRTPAAGGGARALASKDQGSAPDARRAGAPSP